jgi:hypothetical protein
MIEQDQGGRRLTIAVKRAREVDHRMMVASGRVYAVTDRMSPTTPNVRASRGGHIPAKADEQGRPAVRSAVNRSEVSRQSRRGQPAARPAARKSTNPTIRYATGGCSHP